jgi:G3E family GTPase/thiol-disulfide isomerase/thioredoxin
MESLAERNEAAGEDDDRNVADLLLDQIEFADVIVLNKCDLISINEAQRLESLLKTLNPGAEVILTTNSQVPISKVINTGRFDFEKAAQSAGWLKSLQEDLVPETEEYGIGSFVFRSRKPFHPGRLYAFMSTYFCLQEPDWREAMGMVPENEEEEKVPNGLISAVPTKEPLTIVRESAMSAANAAENAAKALRQLCSLDGSVASDSGNEFMLSAALSAASAASAASSCAAMILAMEMATSSKQIKTVAGDDVVKKRRHQLHESFGQLLRSKGFVWIATRRDLCGEWSQAGGVLRFTVGGPWYAALPEEAWPQSSEERRVVQQDFDGPGGDRRQELVFIGIDLKKDALISALNACLVSEEEEKHLAQLPDPFAVWPSLDQILGDTETVDSTPEAFHSVSPGVIEIERGAAQVQSILDNEADSGELCIVQWHAPWCEPSDRACEELERLANRHPHIKMLRVNVDAPPANNFFAMEKVMEKPNARRDGAKPVLRMGRKFPAFTVHRPPNLQPVDIISGPDFFCRLEEIIGLREPSVVDYSSLSTSNAVEVLTAGALQLKAVLTRASQDGEVVVVLWLDDGTLNNPSLQAAHRAPNGMKFTLVQANIAATPQNAVLAKALKVAVVPTFHVYRHMKLEQRLEGDNATVQQLHRVLESHKKEKVADKDSPFEGMSNELDPPNGKYAKPGATKRLADGRTAHFFPKMPCLRCGCPWWSSEEWNGRCVRCGWDCEKQGYDDDSRPLPAYQKKWESFTDSIRQGRTPQWTSRR